MLPTLSLLNGEVLDWEKASHPGTFTSSQRMQAWTMIQKCTYVHCTYEEAFVRSSFPSAPEGTDSRSIRHTGLGTAPQCPPGATQPWPTVSEWKAQKRGERKVNFSYLWTVPESFCPWEGESSWGTARTHRGDWRLNGISSPSVSSTLAEVIASHKRWPWPVV